MSRMVGSGAVIAAAALAVAFAALFLSNGRSAEPFSMSRVIIPGIASDASLPAVTEPELVVHIALSINEPDFPDTPSTVIELTAAAHGPLPGPSDQTQFSVPASFTITPHPNGTCDWTRYIEPTLRMTYKRVVGAGVRLYLEELIGAAWYHIVRCPTSSDPRYVYFRFPVLAGMPSDPVTVPIIPVPPGSPGDESVGGWLRLIFQSAPFPGVIDVSEVTGAGCITHRAHFSKSNAFGTGDVFVYVIEPPCMVVAEN